MQLKKNTLFVALLLTSLLMSLLLLAIEPEDSATTSEEILRSFGDMEVAGSDEPNSLGHQVLPDIARIRALEYARNLGGLEKLAAELEKKWFPRNKEYYGYIMLAVCDAFGSGIFEGNQGDELAKEYARLIFEKSHNLEENEKIPIDAQLKLVGRIETPVERLPERYRDLATSGDWPNNRIQLARFYMETWGRLEQLIDDNWDPNSKPPRPETPAGVSFYYPGMPAERIEDAGLRAKYEAELEEYRLSSKRYNRQRHLARLKKKFVHDLEQHLLRLYSGPLFDSNNLERQALQKDLERHIVDEKVRLMILERVAKRVSGGSEARPEEAPQEEPNLTAVRRATGKDMAESGYSQVGTYILLAAGLGVIIACAVILLKKKASSNRR